MYTPRSITQWEHLRLDNQAQEEIRKLEQHVRELQEALRFYAADRDDAGWRARRALGADLHSPEPTPLLPRSQRP